MKTFYNSKKSRNDYLWLLSGSCPTPSGCYSWIVDIQGLAISLLPSVCLESNKTQFKSSSKVQVHRPNCTSDLGKWLSFIRLYSTSVDDHSGHYWGGTLEELWEIRCLAHYAYVFISLPFPGLSPDMPTLSEFGVTEAFCESIILLTHSINPNRLQGIFISLRILLRLWWPGKAWMPSSSN